MKLVVVQFPNNGYLGGPESASFSISLNNNECSITINQLGKREIIIEAIPGNYKDVLSVYYSLVSLLMLLDGQFYPIQSAFDGTDITSSFKQRELECYSSADFILKYGVRLSGFGDVIDKVFFQKWVNLRADLDIIHNMILYCLSSVKIPKDIQCAFIIEAFNGIFELISSKDSSFIQPSVPKGESKLKHYLLAVIDQYDPLIFSEEITRNKEEFAQILVNSRNRIAHIKTKESRRFLDGGESVMYLLKLSLLYRVVLLRLLGVDENLYINSLKKGVRTINEQDIVKNFISKL